MLKKNVVGGMAAAICLLPSGVVVGASGFADAVVNYDHGTGFATEFGTGAGYTNSVAALGEPSRSTPGTFGGPVDPFNPPYLVDQLVSIGTGGSLTVQFSSPIRNDPTNPFGLDFLVFGNSGFVITNGNYSGGGVTDGSLFSANEFSTRVKVSADNVTYYELAPSLAPVVDSYFPTDGSGDFNQPVNPSLRPGDFSGKDMAGIRALYAGAAGGTGFDLDWARDGAGKPMTLNSISFVRVEVLSGVSEIDGFATVPEPSTWSLFAAGVLGSLLFFKRKQA